MGQRVVLVPQDSEGTPKSIQNKKYQASVLSSVAVRRLVLVNAPSWLVMSSAESWQNPSLSRLQIKWRRPPLLSSLLCKRGQSHDARSRRHARWSEGLVMANPILANLTVANPTLAKPTSTCVCVCLCVFVFSRFPCGGFKVLVWSFPDRPSRDRPSRDRPSRDRPSRDRPPPDRPKFRSFFSPVAKFVLFFPLCRGILVVFLKTGTLKCAVWALGLSC